jgi:hypothetical protein
VLRIRHSVSAISVTVTYGANPNSMRFQPGSKHFQRGTTNYLSGTVKLLPPSLLSTLEIIINASDLLKSQRFVEFLHVTDCIQTPTHSYNYLYEQ